MVFNIKYTQINLVSKHVWLFRITLKKFLKEKKRSWKRVQLGESQIKESGVEFFYDCFCGEQRQTNTSVHCIRNIPWLNSLYGFSISPNFIYLFQIQMRWECGYLWFVVFIMIAWNPLYKINNCIFSAA